MFQCMWDCANHDGTNCNALIRGYNLSAHVREVHGIHGPDKTRVKCKWNHCDRELHKESLARHVLEHHMGVVYECECGKAFSRLDILNRHKRTCPGR
ncbi:hypothetical protein BDR03DRAFT_949297 [Suillus americanus]|nr:hypothetical protein BDR03DRAFT_949297 [Suillus americanus]